MEGNEMKWDTAVREYKGFGTEVLIVSNYNEYLLCKN
jgi:hypothetical protein